MNDKKNSKQSALDRLTDALVDDILAAPDQELLNEMRDIDDDPAVLASRVRSIYARASTSIAKAKLQAAKAALLAERRTAGSNASLAKLDPTAARARLNAFLEQDPVTKAKLTLAARKGEGQSDADVEGMLEDLDELGVRLPSDRQDDD